MSGEPDTSEVALRIQMLGRLLADDSFLDAEIKKEIKKYDDDGNLKIDRVEFQKMLNCYLVTLSEEGSSEKFDDIDKDGSGFIEISELKQVLRKQIVQEVDKLKLQNGTIFDC
ncbi:squidulin-like [Bolinopsis microptera]|uniref:squidulin-like n=1 Tax=Bolinopsis microptera TaxID=2820187 RepID=UPI0030795420